MSDIEASNELHNLQLSLADLEMQLDHLSTQRRVLQDRRTHLLKSTDWSSRRLSFLSLQRIPREERSNLREDLSRNKEALQDTDTELRAMVQRHRHLSFTLEVHKETLAPISQMPIEILQEIFRYTLPAAFVTPSAHHAPLLLTIICKKWRSIALATPCLWSSISTTSDWPLQVFEPQPSISNIDKFLSYVIRKTPRTIPSQPLLWIERAGHAPFHMEITIPKKDYWFGSTDPYYHWVVQTSERWCHLRLTARNINLALLLSKPMPQLKTLELVGLYDRSYDFFMLRTYHAEFDLHPETFSFPWSSLTTLEAADTWFIVDQLLAILEGSPNLRTCRTKIQDLYTVHDFPYLIKIKVVHDSLLNLYISLNDREAYALRRLLDSLSPTSLTTLHIATLKSITRSDWPHAAFLSFSNRCSPPLQTLSLKGFSMRPRMESDWRDANLVTEISASLPLLQAFEVL